MWATSRDGLQAKPPEEIAELRRSLEIGEDDLVFYRRLNA